MHLEDWQVGDTVERFHKPFGILQVGDKVVIAAISPVKLGFDGRPNRTITIKNCTFAYTSRNFKWICRGGYTKPKSGFSKFISERGL